MKIFVDECVYQRTVDLLRSWGFSVITAQEVDLAGHTNGEVLTYSQNHQ
jgi:predicted nuclease of predicted toxin-antitoxin system